MKIAFVVPVNGISGGLLVAYTHAHYLHSIGHEVTVVFVSDRMGIQIDCVPCAARTARLEQVLKGSESFDVVIATWWETYYEMFQIQASSYLYFCQSDERQFYRSKESFEVPFVEYTYMNKNVGIIAVAKWIVNWLKKDYGLDAEYAPNGLDLNLFNPEVTPFSPKKEKVRVLIEGAGRLFFKNVARAFHIANRFSNIEVWYVSSDGYKESNWRCDRMFSSVAYKAMPSIYASCDVLLKLSSIEGFGLPPLEMMACGGTAVVSKISAHQEYVEHEKNALWVELDDEEGACSALKRLIENKELRNRLSENGIQTAKRFGWENRLPMFSNSIEKVREKKLTLTAIEKNSYARINQFLKSRKEQAELLNSPFLRLERAAMNQLKKFLRFLKNRVV